MLSRTFDEFHLCFDKMGKYGSKGFLRAHNPIPYGHWLE